MKLTSLLWDGEPRWMLGAVKENSYVKETENVFLLEPVAQNVWKADTYVQSGRRFKVYDSTLLSCFVFTEVNIDTTKYMSCMHMTRNQNQ
jgi:hypothetical protein